MSTVTPLLHIKHLNLDFHTRDGGTIKALRDVSLRVPTKRIVGIVGESGCGKSTLAWSTLRLLASNAQIRSGELWFDGRDILTLPERELEALRGQKIAMVFQDLMNALNPAFTVGVLMTDALYRRVDLNAQAKRRMVIAMLGKVGIPDPEKRFAQYPHEFSGGMRQRIFIAMTLLCNPDLIIADEPASALDVTIAAQIMNLFQEVRRTFHGSMLFISHNLGLVAELCDDVTVMYAGEVVEQGRVEDIFHRPAHPYTQKLLACDPILMTAGKRTFPTIKGHVPNLQHIPPGCIYYPRCHCRIDACERIHPGIVAVEKNHRCRCLLWDDTHAGAAADTSPKYQGASRAVFTAPRPTHHPAIDDSVPPLLEVDRLRVRFRNQGLVRAFFTGNRDPFIDACLQISLKLNSGDTYGLVGESGSGKTTLGLAIIRLLETAAGDIRFEGRSIRRLTGEDLNRYRRHVAMIFQDPVASLSPRKTVYHLVREPFEVHRISGIDIDEAVNRLFDKVSLPEALRYRYPHQLSGGQARRVGVARALALSPKLVIADEPTAGIDVSVQGEILNLMRALQNDFDLSYLIISHNLPVVRHISQRLGIMYLGRIVEQGPTRHIFDHPGHPYTKALIDGIPQPDPGQKRRNRAITGEIPSLSDRPHGCEFHTRCSRAQDRCRHEPPCWQHISAGDRQVLCHFPLI